jgi:hypothetical protein
VEIPIGSGYVIESEVVQIGSFGFVSDLSHCQV